MGERHNAKWDEYAHIKFIELCEQEVRKGNRPNTYLSKDGWKNMVNEFNKKTGLEYTRKQIKNYWDHMKAEWTFFKQLMRGETGLGWDPTRKIIIADDDWRILNTKNLGTKIFSLIWFRYDALFTDIIATGERARAANQEQESKVGLDQDDDGTNDVYDNDIEQWNDERSDESHDLQNMDSITFSEPSLRKRKSIDGSGNSSQVKKRKTKNNSLSLKEEIHSLIEFIYNNSTSRSSEPTIEKCMDILENIPGILEGSDIFNCAVNLLTQKEMRHAFLKLSTDEVRKSWLEYNHR
uniref:L10-interacting MYB domain-containing protein-like n=1 Tax=Nicotiana tabacum TaxID=4097 RepID=A0A1S4DCF9_TOBAC|nr:PREDICTED: L10-interacting MYB domain-containing protein-like [Nicotiana tabacum]